MYQDVTTLKSITSRSHKLSKVTVSSSCVQCHQARKSPESRLLDVTSSMGHPAVCIDNKSVCHQDVTKTLTEWHKKSPGCHKEVPRTSKRHTNYITKISLGCHKDNTRISQRGHKDVNRISQNITRDQVLYDIRVTFS